MHRVVKIALIASAALLSGCGVGSSSSPAIGLAGDPGSDAPPPFLGVMPKAVCGATDRVETGLQGQLPMEDRTSGRAALGYNCNLELVGHYPSKVFSNFDSYKNNVYYGEGDINGPGTGTRVVSVADSKNPVETDFLTARAMTHAGESLRISHTRGLMAANYYGNPDDTHYFSVYDVKKNPDHPVLLADTVMPNGLGHEGCFQPDGSVYYMAGSNGNIVTPVDLTDPTHPVELTNWALNPHGCSVSDDGKKLYIVEVYNGPQQDAYNEAATVAPPLASEGGAVTLAPTSATPLNRVGVVIADVSDVQAHKPGAELKRMGFFSSRDNWGNQGTIPVTYGSKEYFIVFSELAKRAYQPRCAASTDSGDQGPNFGYGSIVDVSDPTKPVEISRLLLEVHDPANCALIQADYGALFVYDFHHCRTDRLHDPTILACSNFMSGLRVFDIRNPYQPKELAYFNLGTASADDPGNVLDAYAPPVIRRDRGEIWFTAGPLVAASDKPTSTTLVGGLYVVKFREGVWPFEGDDACKPGYDRWADQYDPTYCRSTW